MSPELRRTLLRLLDLCNEEELTIQVENGCVKVIRLPYREAAYIDLRTISSEMAVHGHRVEMTVTEVKRTTLKRNAKKRIWK